MAGYFYNDAKVREIDGFPELQSALDAGPVLVLAGPGERRRLERMPGLRTTALAPGPRGNVLLKVERTPAGGLN
jgi:hypothetical protein